ncbi:putative structural protein [Arthrobacter phage vB_ArtM-ArV1]|uniref:Putative structural protein n=1 Tax=Arthrobacter phage vB_ArtM-ArV1 TaxID=1566993 RepID=A0A0A7HBR9_9CAUD|nr:putative structural protein [Arthrobacter phage vB_ArtM-ArV1]AIZ01701.1 putative structural protein [Arthrobacter phage vB_ArtM-ArV1]
MLGAEGVARALVYRIQARFPAKLAEIRTRLAVDAAELPELNAIYPHEINLRAVNAYPCMSVVEYETTGRIGNRQMDSDGDYDEYSYRYRMRVFIWGMGTDHVGTDLLRKRLTLAAREVLLNDKIFYDQGGQYAELDPATLKESFSDVGDVADNQFLGGAYLEFEVVTQETLKAYQGRVSDDPATIIPELGAVGEGDTHPVPQPEP